MTDKFKYVCKVSSNYGEKGQVVALEMSPEQLTDRQSVMLKPYVEPSIKGLESGEAQTVDVDALKAEGAKEAHEALVKVYEFVTGKKVGNLKDPAKIADKIIADLEANEEEQQDEQSAE